MRSTLQILITGITINTNFVSVKVVGIWLLTCFSLSWPSVGTTALIEGDAALSVGSPNKINTAINDWEFAESMRKLLIDGKGKAKVSGAIFLFNECYGGGMLDDLAAAFAGTNMNWIAGAATSPGQKAIGQDSEGYFKSKLAFNPKYPPWYADGVLAIEHDLRLKDVFVGAPPHDFWTSALLPELATRGNTVLSALENSFENDAVGPNAADYVKNYLQTYWNVKTGTENGTMAFGGTGNTLRLADAGTKSAHAILWAGLNNRDRFNADASDMAQVLRDAWAGVPAVTIDKLGVLGSPSATRDNLTNTLNGIANQLGPNELFLFYATGHGEPGNPRPVPAPVQSGKQSSFLNLPDWEFADMNWFHSSPSIDISYSGLTAEASVTFNDHFLGDLPVGNPNHILTASFPIDLSWVSLQNEVGFINTGTPFTLQGLQFLPGECCDISVDEPGVIPLLLIGLGGFALSSQRRRRRKISAGSPNMASQ